MASCITRTLSTSSRSPHLCSGGTGTARRDRPLLGKSIDWLMKVAWKMSLKTQVRARGVECEEIVGRS